MWAALNFIKNNKKTIAAAATIATGFFFAKKTLSNLDEQWVKSPSRDFCFQPQNKKSTHFDESLCIGNNMAVKQCRIIIEKLWEKFNIVELLKKIETAQKNNVPPNEQLQYFEELKINIFTYIVSKIYSIAFFVTYLRVQLAMISGAMFHENQNNNAYNNFLLKDTTSRYSMFLSLIENFHQKGVDHLVTAISKIVSYSCDQMKITDKITIKNMINKLNEIRRNIQMSSEELIQENALLIYQNSNSGLRINENMKYVEIDACSKFTNEMIDITNSSYFRKTLLNCVDYGFSNWSDSMYDCFSKCLENDQNEELSNIQERKVLLIKLLPIIWDKNQTSIKKNKKEIPIWVELVLQNDNLTSFTENIYEAFCNPK